MLHIMKYYITFYSPIRLRGAGIAQSISLSIPFHLLLGPLQGEALPDQDSKSLHVFLSVKP